MGPRVLVVEDEAQLRYAMRRYLESNAYVVREAEDGAGALREFEAANADRRIEISRFKGLGEMDWQELGATTMDPASRSLLQVSVERDLIANDVFSELMGEDVETRRTFIQQNAKDVRFLDI